MIIFDLDGTLADGEHRRHFIDPNKNLIFREDDNNIDLRHGWKPNWKAFYEACDEDEPILPVIQFFNHLWAKRTGDLDVMIWSGRCESIRGKTEQWIDKNLECGETWPVIQMRPIGDSTPDDILKERWLDEHIEMVNGKRQCRHVDCNHYKCTSPIDYVFEDRPEVVRMWRRRGIFVFDVNQSGKEF